MITSFIIHYLGWQAGIRVVCPNRSYPPTGLFPRNAPVGIFQTLRRFRGLIVAVIPKPRSMSALLAPNETAAWAD